MFMRSQVAEGDAELGKSCPDFAQLVFVLAAVIRGESEESAGRLWVVPGILDRRLEALGEFPPPIRHGWGCRGR